MARAMRSQSSSGKENRSSPDNKKSSNTNNQSSKRYTKREFKFYAADSGIKNPYTYEKIEEAIILKIQTTFEGVTMPDIAKSLRS